MTLSEVIISFSVLAKFNLPAFAPLILRDSAGVEVDSDLFDEVVTDSFKAFTEEGSGKKNSIDII